MGIAVDSAAKVVPEAAGFDAERLARVDEHLRTRYIEPGKIAGCQVAVTRHGQLAHFTSLGSMDRERQRPVQDDTIWRLYSMTKPITGTALLTLYEKGLFQLSDPVHRFIPAFRDMKVTEKRGDERVLVDAERPISVRDAMMHMTGIGYGPEGARLDMTNLVNRGERQKLLGHGATLQSLMDALGGEPLRFHPGTHWLYSWSIDVCARLVEVISGQRFDEYLQQAIFDPLGMPDTGFSVKEPDVVGSRRSTAEAPRRSSGCSTTPRPAGRSATPRCCSAAAGCSAPRPTTSASPTCW